MTLNEYNKKRNFNETKEPKGKTSKTKQNRFVIQYHEARAKHYDFRLEYNGVLLSWAVPKGLPNNEKQKRLAVHVEDHPVDYITFEGTIPKGEYGAGTVEIFDKGTYVQINDFKKGLKESKLKFYLQGEKLQGVWTLIKKDEKNWFIIKCKDEYLLEAKNLNKNPFDKVDVELALLSSVIPKGNDWLFEIKYDGYRIVAFIEPKKVVLKTRNSNDYTTKFTSISDSLKKHFKISAILDGEVVVFDKDGKSDFSSLQQSIKSTKEDFAYVIFDILALNGQDLRDLPLIKRKELLKEVLKNAPTNLMYSEHIIGHGKECFNLAKKKGLEGIVAKNINSKYKAARIGDWLKIKCYLRQEFVVCGYTTSSNNKLLSSIVVGYYDGKKLINAGKVGTGFTEKQKEELNSLFKKLITKKETISNAPKGTIFLKPKLVAEIQFAELTKDRVLRQPSFIGLREDKDAKQVVLESKNE